MRKSPWNLRDSSSAKGFRTETHHSWWGHSGIFASYLSYLFSMFNREFTGRTVALSGSTFAPKGQNSQPAVGMSECVGGRYRRQEDTCPEDVSGLRRLLANGTSQENFRSIFDRRPR
jgi:hypothetical protein